MMTPTNDASAVLCIGRIYCDLIFTGLGGFPQLGREVFAEGMEIAAGGGAFIAAAHFVHAGRRTALVARLGTDPLSAEVETQIRASGADLRFIEHSAEAGPQVTVASVVGEERAFLTRRAGGAKPSTLDESLSWDEACHLHIAEYATLHEIPELVSLAKAKGLTVSLDPSWDEKLIRDPGLFDACKGVDIFLPNLEEAEAMTGRRDPEAALENLSRAFPLVALKGGADGAWLKFGERVLHVPAQKVPVVDTTGAGDAFNAGFIDAWLRRAPEEQWLEAGIRAASLAIQAPGGATVFSRAVSQVRGA
ncbi:PfkB family carbohydrate kinase [Rhizobium sp. LC145]|jgi:sugar/nucleoside kinase (ribokinase family)|uniref:carbohydrate kinase family protein n=1 Tax=Rhizobium sp. LC145 TaxID=1120688 RepID=UPI00062A2834|nr:PfkB family carbohydrate kinase [Rhizobium sp. LC145]KKX33180.1 ribokinase [Rhizobium sp. LC145]TKT68659.1 ribokinase [Rhizobiaceae bacterium LC148]